MLRLPAIKCTETEKATCYQTAMTVHDLVPYLLNGHDPRSQNWKNLPLNVRTLYEKLQRKTSKSRREAMRSYILRRMSPEAYWIGAIPPVVVGMQLPQTFEMKEGDDGLGYVKVTTRLDRPNILLDGLGRITGFLDVMYDEDLSAATRKWAGEAVIPIMLVTPPGIAELSLEELGQLFHDMNVLSTPVGKGQAVDLDRSDLYIRTVNEIVSNKTLEENGGCDQRAVSISPKSGAWTTKTVLLKSVRAAAEGPGSHVDHLRDVKEGAYLTSPHEMNTIVERYDEALRTFVEALPESRVPMHDTLLRTSVWWVALGLVLHDLHDQYDGETIGETQRLDMLGRLAKIDWGLGNSELRFLGQTVAEKDGATPTDASGRKILNRFYGGSKAYYNLAAYMRRKIGLTDAVAYGPDYGATERFDVDSPTVAVETVVAAG
ncbi:MAG: DNA sulfur modification protein DndB [Sneathiellaceae bacterium]